MNASRHPGATVGEHETHGRQRSDAPGSPTSSTCTTGTADLEALRNASRERKIVIKQRGAIGLCILLTVAEVVVGFKAGSLALITNGVHIFLDVLDFIISISGEKGQRQESNPNRSYAYLRLENFEVLACTHISWFTVGIILCDVWTKAMSTTFAVNGRLVFIMGSFGLLANLALMYMCYLAPEDFGNLKSEIIEAQNMMNQSHSNVQRRQRDSQRSTEDINELDKKLILECGIHGSCQPRNTHSNNHDHPRDLDIPEYKQERRYHRAACTFNSPIAMNNNNRKAEKNLHHSEFLFANAEAQIQDDTGDPQANGDPKEIRHPYARSYSSVLDVQVEAVKEHPVDVKKCSPRSSSSSGEDWSEVYCEDLEQPPRRPVSPPRSFLTRSVSRFSLRKALQMPQGILPLLSSHDLTRRKSTSYRLPKDEIAAVAIGLDNDVKRMTNVQNCQATHKKAAYPYLHIVSDLGQRSALIIIGGMIWVVPDYKIADLVCALVFSLIILISTSKRAKCTIDKSFARCCIILANTWTKKARQLERHSSCVTARSGKRRRTAATATDYESFTMSYFAQSPRLGMYQDAMRYQKLRARQTRRQSRLHTHSRGSDSSSQKSRGSTKDN